MQSSAGRVELTIENSSGQRALYHWRAMLDRIAFISTTKSDLAPGTYRAIVFQPTLQSPPSESFNVVAPPGELANLRADWSALQQLAEQSRGRFYLSNQAQKLFEELPLGKPARLGTLPPLPTLEFTVGSSGVCSTDYIRVALETPSSNALTLVPKHVATDWSTIGSRADEHQCAKVHRSGNEFH